ncbi:MAG: glutamate 5-kinase [Thermodesulfobacteriota bacterium]|nr:glutamate 5-kinase [Thermodesulfobacteriota bacterium]
MKRDPREDLKKCKRILVKIGSRVLNTEKGLNYRVIERLCDDLSLLKDKGLEFGLVSSGAIAAGWATSGGLAKGMNLSRKQALAAIGQGRLIRAYNDAFRRYGYNVAQILITREDLDDRTRYLNVRNTFTALFELGIVPIINENDTVSVEEIQFTDNDMLSAMIVPIIEAQALIILTDTDGVLSVDPRLDSHATRTPEIRSLTRKHIADASKDTGKMGRGGMASKLSAAYHVSLLGLPTVIASAYHPQVVSSILDAGDIGTIMLPRQKKKLSQRGHWISFVTRPKGEIEVDAGAKKMIINAGKSLLPSGIVRAEGDFEAGDSVKILDTERNVIAIGLSNFSLREVIQIKGAKTKDIHHILGKETNEEIVHRNNMILEKEML